MENIDDDLSNSDRKVTWKRFGIALRSCHATSEAYKKVLVIGLGPLGLPVAKYIRGRILTAAVDVDHKYKKRREGISASPTDLNFKFSYSELIWKVI